MLLKLVPSLPSGDHWRYEVKWDGYRCIAVVEQGKAKLWSRNERDLGRRFPVLVETHAIRRALLRSVSLTPPISSRPRMLTIRWAGLMSAVPERLI